MIVNFNKETDKAIAMLKGIYFVRNDLEIRVPYENSNGRGGYRLSSYEYNEIRKIEKNEIKSISEILNQDKKVIYNDETGILRICEKEYIDVKKVIDIQLTAKREIYDKYIKVEDSFENNILLINKLIGKE